MYNSSSGSTFTMISGLASPAGRKRGATVGTGRARGAADGLSTPAGSTAGREGRAELSWDSR